MWGASKNYAGNCKGAHKIMTRQLEQGMEDARSKRERAIVRAVENGLEDSIGFAGGVLLGFSVRTNPEDVLMTLRVELAGRKQIAFVGGSDLGSTLIKACREARQDKLKWRDDKFAK